MAKRKPKLKFPRVPLPRQTGGAPKVKKDILDRKAKHRKPIEVEVWE